MALGTTPAWGGVMGVVPGQRGWAGSVVLASPCWRVFACSPAIHVDVHLRVQGRPGRAPPASVSPPRPQEQPWFCAREAHADTGATLCAWPRRGRLRLGAGGCAALHGAGTARPRRPPPLPALPCGRAAPVSPALSGTPPTMPPPQSHSKAPPLKADVHPLPLCALRRVGMGDALAPLGAQLYGAAGGRHDTLRQDNMVALPPIPSWSHHGGFCPCARSHHPPRSPGVRMWPPPRPPPQDVALGTKRGGDTAQGHLPSTTHKLTHAEREDDGAGPPGGGSMLGGVGASCAVGAAHAHRVPARKEATGRQSSFPKMGGPRGLLPPSQVPALGGPLGGRTPDAVGCVLRAPRRPQ